LLSGIISWAGIACKTNLAVLLSKMIPMIIPERLHPVNVPKRDEQKQVRMKSSKIRVA
jgi:hypothetical protein